MKKRKPVCDRDCFHCKYKDCIDGRPFLTAFERKCLRGIRYTNGKAVQEAKQVSLSGIRVDGEPIKF